MANLNQAQLAALIADVVGQVLAGQAASPKGGAASVAQRADRLSCIGDLVGQSSRSLVSYCFVGHSQLETAAR